MKEELMIINHYGLIPQLKHLQTEMFELIEAIITHELKRTVEYEIPLTEIIGAKEHIEEEFADVTFMLKQIKEFLELDEIHIEKWQKFKCKRQLNRIKEEK